MTKLLIANPSYSPGSVSRIPQIWAWLGADGIEIHDFEIAASLLTWSFNTAWAYMLNLKESDGLTHFLMIHADVKPKQRDWLKILFKEMETMEADIVSAIIPIKDQRGLTSTAFDTDPWRPLRVTQKQSIEQLPVTWTHPKLLFNTGLWLADIRKPWVYDVCFHMEDRIRRDENGKWVAEVQPEDWHFSRQCHALGVKCFATRAVELDHLGQASFPSTGVWGEPVDNQNAATMARNLESGQLTMEAFNAKG